MKISETLKLLNDKDFLDKIYHFSYHRCNSSFEAEDLSFRSHPQSCNGS